MKLEQLINGVEVLELQGNKDIDIKSINYDSRRVENDSAFVCIKGENTDGHLYINDAISKGASAIFTENEISPNPGITFIRVENTKKALALISANFYNQPTRRLKLIGVTGTKGKTTTSYMIKSILEAAGHKVGLIGTIVNIVGDEITSADRTTPMSLDIQRMFAKMLESGQDYAVMEVSSHSLDLYRVYGVEFAVGIFTNLTRDHLDYHKTFDNYFEAKAKLFSMCKTAVINIDDTYGKKLSGMVN
jgi:UDP-N-acetylmuramoyl-L-alanyl-D-glutamate--2,6-diaminopimelate ligase